MIRVFMCPECGKTRIVSKFLKADCYACGAAMRFSGISYSEWVELGSEEREKFRTDWMHSEKEK